MKKNASHIQLILVSIFLLSGCLNYEQVSNLKIDGSGDTYIHFWGKINNAQDSVLFSTSGLFDENTLRSKFDKSFVDVTSIETYSTPNDSTIHSKVKFSFANIDSLNQLSVFTGTNFTFITDDEGDIVFSQSIDSTLFSPAWSTPECLFTYTYYLPGKILEHNAGQKSNNKLVWTFNSTDLGKSNKLIARFTPYKLKETPNWVYYSSLFILVIVVLYMFKRRRP